MAKSKSQAQTFDIIGDAAVAAPVPETETLGVGPAPAPARLQKPATLHATGKRATKNACYCIYVDQARPLAQMALDQDTNASTIVRDALDEILKKNNYL